MKAILKNDITITGNPSFNLTAFLTLKNPKHQENVRMGRWNKGIPENLKFYERKSNGLHIPRGFGYQLAHHFAKNSVKITWVDERRCIPSVDFEFYGTLKPFQEQAVEDILKRDFGVLCAPTGSGKTVIGLAIIAKRQQPTLIVVHTLDLLNQWLDRVHAFLGISENQIGIIGGGKKTIGERITIATVQTLYKCAKDIIPFVGQVIVDECHRAPSRTFTQAIKEFDCKYLLGLSATPYRRDGLSKVIYFYMGDVVHSVDKSLLIEKGDILQAKIVVRETDFETKLDPVDEYSRVLSQLTLDNQRNNLIASDVYQNYQKGVSLVLSDRKAHCERIRDLLVKRYHVQAQLLTGDTKMTQRQDIIQNLNNGNIQVVCATGQLLGEGFDSKALSYLFLATPIKFSGRLIQYLGRVLRPAPGKEPPMIFDYADVKVAVLLASFKSRMRVYGIDYQPKSIN